MPNVPVIRLSDIVRGKTVAVVGNSEPEFDCSAEIDACDVVIRLNHAYNMVSGKVGTRTDVLVVTPCAAWSRLSADEKGLSLFCEQKPLVLAVKHGERMELPEVQEFFVHQCGCELGRDEPTAPSVARFTTGTVVLAKLAEFAEGCEIKTFGFSSGSVFLDYLKKDGSHYLPGASAEACAREAYFAVIARKRNATPRAASVRIVIPARSGSSLKDKNLRPWKNTGKSLLEIAVAKALQATGGIPPIVLTDSEVYASIARDAGAEVPYVEPTTSDDENVVVKLRRWRDVSGFSGWILLHQCTSPELRSETLDAFLDAATGEAQLGEAWLAVVRERRKHTAFFTDGENGELHQLDGSIPPSVPRQVLPQAWWFFGGASMVHTDDLDASELFAGASFRKIECLPSEAIDIDNEPDFEK